MTAVDVDALDAARAAATAGPWTATAAVDSLHMASVHIAAGEIAQAYESADAALIVAAVNALAPLLDEVRRGRALRERLEKLHTPDEFGCCPSCDHGYQDGTCDTSRALAATDPS